MIRNYNILRVHSDRSLVYTNREYAISTPMIIAEQRKIPPFQIIRRNLANTPITTFELTRCETGETIDILTEITASALTIQYGGEIENYDATGLGVQASGESYSGWGWTIGSSFSKFRFLRVYMYCDDFNNIPTKFTARVKSAVAGSVLIESSEVQVVPKFKQAFSVVFDFGSVYDNSTPFSLYLEVKGDGVWSTYGKDSYSGATIRNITYTGSEYDYPDTDASSNTYSGRVVGTQYGGNYDVIVNDGTAINKYLHPGTYTFKMSDGEHTWWSERFIVMNHISDKIKINYWHNEDFTLPLGTMRYYNGYKNNYIVQSKIRSPEYIEAEEKVEKNLVNLPIVRSSDKRYRFKFLASEYMLDSIKLIWQHHNITIENEGLTYTVDDFNFNIEEWDEKGFFAYCVCEFTANEVVTTTGNRSLTGSYIPEEVLDITVPEVYISECIESDYQTNEEIDIANIGTYSALYNKYVIVDNAGSKSLYYWDGSTLSGFALNNYDIVRYSNGGTNTFYYWYSAELKTDSEILTVTNTGGLARNVQGRTFKNAYVQVEYELPGSNFAKTKVYDGLEFINNGIDISPLSISQFRVYVFGKECTFTTSAWKPNI